MPSLAKVRYTGSEDCSTNRMIASFSEAGYLMRRSPSPDHAFFEQAVFEHELGDHLLQRAGLPAQIADLVQRRRPRRVAGQALLPGLQNSFDRR